jgi:hypothetical protein
MGLDDMNGDVLCLKALTAWESAAADWEGEGEPTVLMGPAADEPTATMTGAYMADGGSRDGFDRALMHFKEYRLIHTPAGWAAVAAPAFVRSNEHGEPKPGELTAAYLNGDETVSDAIVVTAVKRGSLEAWTQVFTQPLLEPHYDAAEPIFEGRWVVRLNEMLRMFT